MNVSLQHTQMLQLKELTATQEAKAHAYIMQYGLRDYIIEGAFEVMDLDDDFIEAYPTESASMLWSAIAYATTDAIAINASMTAAAEDAGWEYDLGDRVYELSFNAVRWLDSVNKLAQSTLEDWAKEYDITTVDFPPLPEFDGEVGDIEMPEPRPNYGCYTAPLSAFAAV